jgi:hypothetical protein
MTSTPSGPTAERLAKTDGCFTVAGQAKSQRRFNMLDDALGRAWVRQKISDEEYAALRRYAHHWTAGGLQSPLRSVDLDRVHAIHALGGSGTERMIDHQDAYYAARGAIGKRPADIADKVACYDVPLVSIGSLLGYRSPWRGYEAAAQALSEAGYRLSRHWKERDH